MLVLTWLWSLDIHGSGKLTVIVCVELVVGDLVLLVDNLKLLGVSIGTDHAQLELILWLHDRLL